MNQKLNTVTDYRLKQKMRYAAALFLNLFFCSLLFGQEDEAGLRVSIQKARTDSQRMVAYRNIIRYFDFTNSDSAIHYAQQGINLFSSANYDLGKATITNILGAIYARKGLYDIAKQKNEEALAIFTSLNNKTGIANAQNSLGVIEGKKGNYKIAIQDFLKSLAIFESISDTAGIINTYIKLGAANDFCRNFDKSLGYYNDALALSKNSPSQYNAIFLNSNMGSVYCRMGDFNKAKIYLQKALDLSVDPKYAKLRLSPLTNMGNIYKDGNDDVNALKYFGEALNIAEKEEQSEEYIRLLLSIAEITAKKDPGKAMASLQKALKTTKEAGEKNMEADVLEAMIDVNVLKNDYKEAFNLQRQKHDLLDSIYDINKAEEIANLQAVYELNKSNEQIAALKVSEHKNEKKRDLIIVIAFSLGASVLTMLLLYRNSRRLNVQLAKRTDELKKANDVKDKFFSIIGHDLNNAIENMPILLELYRHENSTQEEKVIIIDSLEETAQISSEILENLLNWGKSRIKGIALNQTYFEANDIIQNKIHLMRIGIKNKNITVLNNTPAETKIYADINHFTFVIRNILSNAIKYTKANGTIEIGAGRADSPGYVLFSVKDNGIGMSSLQLKTIFDPFNVSSPGTSNEAGNSIGLLLCKEFVVANGGKVWAESGNSGGSIFYFTFKLHS